MPALVLARPPQLEQLAVGGEVIVSTNCGAVRVTADPPAATSDNARMETLRDGDLGCWCALSAATARSSSPGLPPPAPGSEVKRMSLGDGTIKSMSTEGTGDYRPVSSIEPLWQVMVDGRWLTVDTVVATEQPDGTGLVWLYFVDHRPAVAVKTDLVRSRIPEEIH